MFTGTLLCVITGLIWSAVGTSSLSVEYLTLTSDTVESYALLFRVRRKRDKSRLNVIQILNAKCTDTTDGFHLYSWVLKRMLGSASLFEQVAKKRKKNRITKVDRKVIISSKEQIADALECSEDLQDLNTSFIERLNLTIRRNTS